MRRAVKALRAEQTVPPQNKYLSFSAHYAFDLDFCNPSKGNEKGLVENLVGYSRRNFLVPVPRVSRGTILFKYNSIISL